MKIIIIKFIICVLFVLILDTIIEKLTPKCLDSTEEDILNYVSALCIVLLTSLLYTTL